MRTRQHGAQSASCTEVDTLVTIDFFPTRLSAAPEAEEVAIALKLYLGS